jgi:hypothetical protein
MNRSYRRRMRSGGNRGNDQLTAIVAALLVLLLAVEGATLLQIRPLLTVHGFVGMLLVPIVALKLGSVGWRMLRYYGGGAEYVAAGPPHIFLRALVAPIIVVSTVVLFATGIALLALERTGGILVGLHKASFVVWFGATSVHVLVHAWKLRRAIAQRVPGLVLRLTAVGAALAAGAVLAVATLPSVDRLQDQVTANIGLDMH